MLYVVSKKSAIVASDESYEESLHIMVKLTVT